MMFLKKSRLKVHLLLTLLLMILLSGCGKQTTVVNIAAASSLTEALKAIQTAYEKESNHKLQFNFGGSGALQKQIEEGAPCDLYISAAKSNMDQLEEQGLILGNTRKDLLGNRLVLIASSEKAAQIEDLESLGSVDVGSIAIGTPESVPAGKYAKQTLEKLKIWNLLADKMIFTKDVKQVLEYVESGNVDCGFVYQTDAMLLKTGVVVNANIESSHDPIVYPIALTTDSAEAEAAKAFYEFLQTDRAQAIFEKYGFIVLI